MAKREWAPWGMVIDFALRLLCVLYVLFFENEKGYPIFPLFSFFSLIPAI
jgi:hypothetical protein